MKSYNSRKEVPEKYKWDLSNFVKDEKDYQAKINFVKENLKKLKDFVGCTKDSKKLREYMEFDIELGGCLERLDAYTYLLQDEDLANDEAKEKRLNVLNLLTEYVYESSFFTPELIALSKEEYESLFKDESLLEYKSYLDESYRFKDHSLTEDEERVGSLLTGNLGTYSSIQSTILNSCNDYGKVTLEDGTEETLTLTNYRKLMKKSGREKRKEIYLQFHSVVRRYAPIIAIALNDYVKEHVAIAKIYHFNSSWERKLFSIKLPEKVFDTLTSVVEERKDLNIKAKKLREEVLDLDKLMPWDSVLDLVKDNKEYTIEDAKELLFKALAPLGEDYLRHFKHIFDSKSIDFCQYKGKTNGAYSVSAFNEHDGKILMSFNGNFNNVSTIAHEGGHNVNHQYIVENNMPLYSTNSSLTGEVASLTNEFILSYYMSNLGDKDEALTGLSNAIDIIDANIIGAVIEGNIERKMYDIVEKGGSLTAALLDDLVEKEILNFNNKESLDHEYQKNGWCLRGHYFRNFYLYSYSISASVASFIAKNIIEGNKEVLDKYLEFLKIGSDVSVEDAYKVLGVNLEDKTIYEEAMDFYDSLLDKFKEVKES